jgi:hypothetical protein
MVEERKECVGERRAVGGDYYKSNIRSEFRPVTDLTPTKFKLQRDNANGGTRTWNPVPRKSSIQNEGDISYPSSDKNPN